MNQLSPDIRRRLPDVIPAASGLERASAALRQRLDQLDRAMADLPSGSPLRAEIAAAREKASSRFADCVTALENVRADLIRLSLGLGQSDGLTLALEKAKELGAAIDAELHGRAEVQKLIA